MFLDGLISAEVKPFFYQKQKPLREASKQY
jgi:hypothetical protein